MEDSLVNFNLETFNNELKKQLSDENIQNIEILVTFHLTL